MVLSDQRPGQAIERGRPEDRLHMLLSCVSSCTEAAVNKIAMHGKDWAANRNRNEADLQKTKANRGKRAEERQATKDAAKRQH